MNKKAKNKDTSDSPQKGNGWAPAIVSIILGAFFTVLVGWYTIYYNNQQTLEANEQSLQAEKERYIKVKDDLVSIIEEYVVDEKQIDIATLQRLINIRTKEETLKTNILISDIIQKAEYNILNSKHLSVDEKSRYKDLIRIYYDELNETTASSNIIDLPSFEEHQFSENLKNLSVKIQEKNTKEALILLKEVASKYEDILKKNSSEVRTASKIGVFDLLQYLYQKPSMLFPIGIGYAFILFTYFFWANKRQKRKDKIILISHKIESLREELKRHKGSEAEKNMIQEELHYLARRLNSIDPSRHIFFDF